MDINNNDVHDVNLQKDKESLSEHPFVSAPSLENKRPDNVVNPQDSNSEDAYHSENGDLKKSIITAQTNSTIDKSQYDIIQSDKINRSESTLFIASGQVLGHHSNEELALIPVAGAAVHIYALYLQNEEKKIGDAITDSNGYYKVSVFNASIDQKQVKEIGQKILTDKNSGCHVKYEVNNKSEYISFNGNVSLIARVYDKTGSLIGSSSLVCAQLLSDIKMPSITLSIDVDKAVVPSEYDCLINAILPFFKDKKVSIPYNLITILDQISCWQDKDIDIVSCQTGINKERLTILIKSSLLQKKACEQKLGLLSTEVFYGLSLQGINFDFKQASLWKAKSSMDALQKATKSNIISYKLLDSIDNILEQLTVFMTHQALDSPLNDVYRTVDLLKLCIPTTEDQLTFLKLLFNHDDPMDELWKKLNEQQKQKQPSEFSILNNNNDASPINRIQTTFQIAELTHNNIPLIKSLLNLKKESPLQSIQELTVLDYSDWMKLFDNSSIPKEQQIPIPSDITGNNHNEKVSNYIGIIINTLEKAYPSPYIIKRISQTPSIDTNIVRKILEQNPTFDPHFDPPKDINWGEIGKDKALKEKALEALEIFRHEVNMFYDVDYMLLLSFENKKSSMDKTHAKDMIDFGKTKLSSSSDIKDSNVLFINPIRENTKKFFANCPDFDLIKHPVANYIEEHKDAALKGIDQDFIVQTIKHIQSVQRITRVAPKSEYVQTLLGEGLDSSYRITKMAQEFFVDRLGVKLGGKGNAQLIYNTALHTHSLILNAATNAIIGLRDDIPRAIGSASDSIKEIPDIATLFPGSLNFCECKHCHSVYSPAAYFVDLLEFLRWTPNNEALNELLNRRPDLEYIKLNCENTNTLIPYVDLVNEILESYIRYKQSLPYVGHKLGTPIFPPLPIGVSPLPYDPHPNDTTEGATPDQLGVNPENINYDAYKNLEQAVYPFSLPFNLPLEMVRVYLEHLGVGFFSLLESFQKNKNIMDPSKGDPSDFAIASEYLKISLQEYQILTGKDFLNSPVSFPSTITQKVKEFYGFYNFVPPILKLWSVRPEVVFLQHRLYMLGISLGQHHQEGVFDYNTETAVKSFQQSNGLIPDGNVGSDTWDKLLNYDDPGFVFYASFLRFVPEFLSRTGIAYDDLLQLLNTRFINFNKFIELKVHSTAIGEIADPCNLNQNTLEYLFAEDADKIHRFIRLWRKLGDWKIRDLDIVIYVLGKDKTAVADQYKIDEHFLLNLAQMKKLNETLKLPLSTLLSFWADIDTYIYDNNKDDSPYTKIFQNKGIIYPLDRAFELKEPERSDLKVSTTELIKNHIPTILASLRLNDVDLDSMIEQKPYLPKPGINNDGIPAADDVLSLANLSTLYRFSTLAKALKLRIPAFLSLRTLIVGYDTNNPKIQSYPFESVEQTTQFVNIVKKINDSGFSVAELNYLYRNVSASLLPWYSGNDPTPLRQNVTTLLRSLQDGIRKIKSDNTTTTIKPDPSGAILQGKLPSVIDKSLVETAISIINGTSKASDPDKKKFIELNFAHFLDPIEAEQILIPSTPSDLDVEKSYFYVLQHIETYIIKSLSENFIIQTLSQDLSLDSDVARSLLLSQTSPLEIYIDKMHTISKPVFNILLGLVGDGLSADYFNTDNFAGASKKSIDKQINFHWGEESPDSSFITTPANPPSNPPHDNNFSVRWTGKLLAQYDEVYTFYIQTTGKVKLSLDNNVIIDKSAPVSQTDLRRPVEFSSIDVPLKAGNIYSISLDYVSYLNTVGVRSADIELRWSSSKSTPKSIIPTDNFYSNSDFSFELVLKSYYLLNKVGLLIRRLQLSVKEISYIFDHSSDFAGLDLKDLPISDFKTFIGSSPISVPAITIDTSQTPFDLGEQENVDKQTPLLFNQWSNLVDFVCFRNNNIISSEDTDIIDFFNTLEIQTSPNFSPIDTTIDKLGAITGWDRKSLSLLVGIAGFNYINSDLKKIDQLVRLLKCLELIKRLGVSVLQIFKWINLVNKNTIDAEAIEIVQDIKKSVKAKYDDATWFSVAKPLSDVLRVRQRSALVDFILNMSIVKNNRGITDTNGLFDYFLIDVEMGSCMATSRIKQAISSIQLFIQRCLMNLEEKISPSYISAERWAWMKHYRIWEANRKVFLYPENWVEPGLRDNKTPFFKEMESELLQNDIDADDVESAFEHYLEKLDQVSQLQIAGMCWEKDPRQMLQKGMRGTEVQDLQKALNEHGVNPQLVVNGIYDNFTETAVYNFNISIGVPWLGGIAHVVTIMSLGLSGTINILHVFGRTRSDPRIYYYRKLTNNGIWTPWEKVELDIEGEHLIPVSFNNRLYLFWPIFSNSTKPLEKIVINNDPNHYQEKPNIPDGFTLSVKLAWSEYKEKGWSKKQVSTGEPLRIDPGIRPADITFVCENLYNKSIRENVLTIVCITRTNDLDSEYDKSGLPAEVGIPPFILTEKKDSLGYVLPGYFYFRCGNALVTEQLDISYSNIKEAKKPFKLIQTYSPSIFRGKPDRDNPDGMGYIEIPDIPKPKDPQSFVGKEDSLNLYMGPDPIWYDNGWVYPDPATLNFTIHGIPQSTILSITPGIHHLMGPAANAVFLTRDGFFFSDNKRNYFVTREKGGQVPGTGPPKISFSNDPQRPSIMSFASSTNYENMLRFYIHFHPQSCYFESLLQSGGISNLLRLSTQTRTYDIPPTNIFKSEYNPTGFVHKTYPQEIVDFSEQGAYSIYNWELFFHAPFLIATTLSKEQKFEEAQKWFHYIFNPMISDSYDPVPKRYWNFLPFNNNDSTSGVISKLLAALHNPSDPQLEEVQKQIFAWWDNPFNPHLIARMRLMAYQKSVVMKYIDNLIAWGDQLFRQETIETINEAEHCYILAAEILGKRPSSIEATDPKTQTYNTLMPFLDSFSNALVEIESRYPSANPQTEQISNIPADHGISGLGLGTTFYFCIPKNDVLLGYWDTVEDRLSKIRNCMDIEGVIRQLPLFEPPIDPALLVRATAMGQDLNSVFADLHAPLPYYRCQYLIQKSLDMCTSVNNLGYMLLSAFEKKDAEHVAYLRATHEKSLLKAMVEVKKQQVYEATNTKAAIEKSKKVVDDRATHYKTIIDRIVEETQHLDNMKLANDRQNDAAEVQNHASIAHLFPNITASTGPPDVTFGGSFVGSMLNAWAMSINNIANNYSYQSSRSNQEAIFSRRKEDWVFQASQADLESSHIQAQIDSADNHLKATLAEQDNLQTQINQSSEVEDFLRSKFTKEDLYQWMKGKISEIYFQAYKEAYKLAKRAEQAFRFERGVVDSNFIQFGYWDNLKKGLMAGESLHLALKQMEHAYIDQNKREYEITKYISLVLFAPSSLIELKETGKCQVILPEELFDADYPGHYMRRIKNVTLTIPCVVGPYTSINCKLTLLQNKIRTSSIAASPYAEQEDDSRIITNAAVVQSIATSHGQNDSGMFELNFRDERYLPFEGGGVCKSTWLLEMPRECNNFDFNTISDVVFKINYTSREGGQSLKTSAWKNLQDVDSGQDRMFNSRHEFPNNWYKFLHPGENEKEQILQLKLEPERFPFLLDPDTITINKAFIFVKLKYKIKSNRLNISLKNDKAGLNENMWLDKISLYGSDILYGQSPAPNRDFGCDITKPDWYIQIARKDIPSWARKKKSDGTADEVITIDSEKCYTLNLESIEDIWVLFTYSAKNRFATKGV